MSTQPDVILVQPPVTWLNPSLALSILKGSLNDAGIPASVDYGSHLFVARIGYKKYKLAEKLMGFINRGWEVMFAPFAGFETAIPAEQLIDMAENELKAYYQNQIPGGADREIMILRKLWKEISGIIPAYLDELTDRILSKGPEIVGLSIMTEQRNAAFAIARELKAKCPSLVIILGGGVCTREVGTKFLEAAPAIDYVYTGEGDRGLAEVCRYILDETGKKGTVDSEKAYLKDIHEKFPFILSRNGGGRYQTLKNMDDSPIPDYSDYYQQLQEDEFADEILKFIPVESSRGCWWRAGGDGCRFCGLHYCLEAAEFRSKSPERFWKEIDYLYDTYGYTTFQMADCIIPKRIIRSLPDECPDKRKKYILFVECRTDLTFDEIKKLRQNGFKFLQPGIESLQDDFLRQMNKGRTTIQHLQFLKNCMICNVEALWNVLLMVPGEKESWYTQLIDNMKKVHHFMAPKTVNNILLARGSTFVDKHDDFGIRELRIRGCDLAADPMIEGFTRITADYYFDPDAVFFDDMLRAAYHEVDVWRECFSKHSFLEYDSTEEKTSVYDGRYPDDIKNYEYPAAAAEILDLSFQIVSKDTLAEKTDMPEDELDKILKLLEKDSVVYISGDEVLNLAVKRNADCNQY